MKSPPKHAQLTAELKRRIAARELAPGDQLPSFSQMQTLHGATTTTVNRVYTALENEGLVERQHGRGVFVAHGKRETGIIGCVGMGFGSKAPYWVQLMDGIHRVAERENLQLLILKNHSNARGWDSVDGFLICDVEPQPALALCPPGQPRVALLNAAPDTVSVVADDYQGARLATQRLLELGHRRIAFLHSTNDLGMARVRGYQDALRAADIAPLEDWRRRIGFFDAQTLVMATRGRLDMDKWLREGFFDLGCSALLMQNDGIGIGALHALQESAIQVPDEVSVVSFDGTEICELTRPTLASVAVPLEEIGARGMELLLGQIREGVGRIETIVLPTRFEARESVAKAPT